MCSPHDLRAPRTIPEAELPHNHLLYPARQRFVARVRRGKMRQDEQFTERAVAQHRERQKGNDSKSVV